MPRPVRAYLGATPRATTITMTIIWTTNNHTIAVSTPGSPPLAASTAGSQQQHHDERAEQHRRADQQPHRQRPAQSLRRGAPTDRCRRGRGAHDHKRCGRHEMEARRRPNEATYATPAAVIAVTMPSAAAT